MELKLNSYKIFELGDYISKFLLDNGINTKSELIINVDKKELTKIDEDLFYRENTRDKDFIPSDDEIHISFSNTSIIIKAENDN